MKLYIKLNTFEDCIHLLDGRLKQLTTLIIVICGMRNDSMIGHNTKNLLNLKCFSLTCEFRNAYDEQLVPLFHRLSHIEELTLNICTGNRATFIDGASLHNDILINMLQLRKLIFYICTYIDLDKITRRLSYDNVRVKTYVMSFHFRFRFDCLKWIGNMFPSIILNNTLRVINFMPQAWYSKKMVSHNKEQCSTVEYSHLTSLD
ncbi:unnamed protein product, partial [Rotaria magnacalcarata]